MNELYKKMILALPSNFFENWEWQNGDRFLHKELGSKFWNEKAIGDHEVTSGNTVLYFIPDYQDVLEGEIRPLPSQKQLQSLAIRKESDSSNVFILIEFTAYVKERGYKWYKNKSMECLWLEFLMDTKHHFDWKKDKWVKWGE